jgi:hypothetical protein
VFVRNWVDRSSVVLSGCPLLYFRQFFINFVFESSLFLVKFRYRGQSSIILIFAKYFLLHISHFFNKDLCLRTFLHEFFSGEISLFSAKFRFLGNICNFYMIICYIRQNVIIFYFRILIFCCTFRILF